MVRQTVVQLIENAVEVANVQLDNSHGHHPTRNEWKKLKKV